MKWLLFFALLLPAGLSAAEPGAWDHPQLAGLDQLLVLHDRMLIACIDPLTDVVAQLDEWNAGDYSKAARDMETAKDGEWSGLIRYRKMNPLFPAAREASGEKDIGLATTWTISSQEDAAYAQPLAPVRVDPTVVSLDGNGGHRGAVQAHYGWYAYLTLPHALKPGLTYRISGWKRRAATLRYDPERTISRALKLNQVGFRPADPLKVVYAGSWIPGVGVDTLLAPTSWDVMNATTGAVAASGSWMLRDEAGRCAPTKEQPDQLKRPMITGERVMTADFSSLSTPGTYYLRAPSLGRTWTFRIAEDVYGPAFYTAMRGLFHQRGSFALTRPFTAWERPRLHTGPIGDSSNLPLGFGPIKGDKEYPRFDVIAATTDMTHATPDVVGGWYDAADYDRNIMHYTLIWDLLWMVEQRPGVFTDGQLNLPESGNGIPDVLDEVEFGLRVWLRSQDARGAVAGSVETSSHPAYDDTRLNWTWSIRTRWSSLHFAASAAWFARLVQPFNPALATTYAEAARRAFAFGANPANSLGTIAIPAKRDRGAGEAYSVPFTETEDMTRPYLVMARAQLWLLDRDDRWLEGLARELLACPAPYVWPFGMTDGAPWLYWHLAAAPLKDKLPRPAVQRVRDWLFKQADNSKAQIERMPYRHSWVRDRDFWMSWGASIATNANRAIFAANALGDSRGDMRAILANTANAFGANPLGMSWTTGIGEVYPAILQHEWSSRDSLADPMPGITLYGFTEGIYFGLRRTLWSTEALDREGTSRRFDFCPTPDTPVWRRWAAHSYENAGQCEFTIHETMSSTILSTGMLMSPGWLPDQTLREREPRPLARLYGYWYVP